MYINIKKYIIIVISRVRIVVDDIKILTFIAFMANCVILK